MTSFRTDRNNNPTAFTTDLAKLGGLLEGVDFEQGELFTADGHSYYTAKLLRDPIETTIKLIDKVGFYTFSGAFQRWIYIGIPQFIWIGLLDVEKTKIIQFMYHREGGTELEHLFGNIV